MKSAVIAALLGNLTAIKLDDSVFIQFENGEMTEVNFAQTGFIIDYDKMKDEPLDSTNVQIDKFEEGLDNWHGYQPWYSGFEGNNHNDGNWRNAYDRNETLPSHFKGEEGVDTFTRKMILEYATEGTDELTHEPNGVFTVSKDNTK